jgi:hypothetical protein
VSAAQGMRASPARFVGIAATIAAGWFVAGLIGFAAAAVGLAVAHWRGPRFVAGLAFAALLVTVFLTVVEGTTGPRKPSVEFVTERPLASDTARIAGVLVLVSISVAVARERSADSVDEPDSSG